MFGTQNLWLFVMAGFLLNLSPGPDTIYILGRSATQGFNAGLAAAFGISAGCMVHILAATLGLSAILATSASLFFTIKLMGAAYLIYLAGMMIADAWRNDQHAPELVSALPVASPFRIFAAGFLTNVLNPKVALFFLAFLPQFVAPNAPDKPLAMLFLGLVFNLNGSVWSIFLAWAGARIQQRLSTANAGFSRILNYALAAMFLYFGLRLALSSD